MNKLKSFQPLEIRNTLEQKVNSHYPDDLKDIQTSRIQLRLDNKEPKHNHHYVQFELKIQIIKSLLLLDIAA